MALALLSGHALTGMHELTKNKAVEYVNVLSVGGRLIVSAGETEYHKLFHTPRIDSAEYPVNYRIASEVIRLVMLRAKPFVPNGMTQVLMLQEITGNINENEIRKNQEGRLFVTLLLLENEKLEELKRLPKSVSFPELMRTVNAPEYYLIAMSMDYETELKIGWYIATQKVAPACINVLAAFKSMLAISKAFKTGVYVSDNYVYVDSSKTGIAMYKSIDYAGKPMLISHTCVAAISDFAKNTEAIMDFNHFREWLIASTSYGLAIVWKNLEFKLDSDIDILRRATYMVAYETDYSRLFELVNTIKVGKTSRVVTNLNFWGNQMIVSESFKGTYTFWVSFDQLRMNNEVVDETLLSNRHVNFNTLKELLLTCKGYNRVRFYLYPEFTRMDCINYREDPNGEEEPYYEGREKIVMVFGLTRED